VHGSQSLQESVKVSTQNSQMIVFPGDDISSNGVKTVGPGVTIADDCLRSVKAGMLINKNGKVFIDNRQKRYFPAQGDCVIGIITARIKDGYRVDIGAWTNVNLDALGFENATKRNRPNLEPGAIVYSRVVQADYNVDPDINCIHPATGKAEGYGVLEGGYVIKVSLDTARKCLDPDFIVFKLAKKHFEFEVAVGVNGRIWINAETAKNVFLIANFIQKSDGVPVSRVSRVFKSILKHLED
jgi:exosome complex component RRP40